MSIVRQAKANVDASHSLCGCYAGVNTSTHDINCGKTGNEKPDQQALDCPTCTDVTNLLPAGLFSNLGRRSSGHDDVMEFDVHQFIEDNPELATGENHTTSTQAEEAAARDLCTRTLSRSVLWGHCGAGRGDIWAGVMEDCVEDMLLSDNELFAKSALATLNALCKDQISKDPSSYTVDANGNYVILPTFSTDLCSQDCHEHGSCNKGTCVCAAGWEGVHCDKQVQLVVALQAGSAATARAECDVSSLQCEALHIKVDHDVTSATCHVTDHTNVFAVKATNISGNVFVCELPEFFVGTKVQGHPSSHVMVSVNINGGNSHTILYYVYDSSCIHHDPTSKNKMDIHPVHDVCLISDMCLPDGARNPLVEDQACDAGVDQHGWSDVFTSPVRPEDVTLTLSNNNGHLTCHVGHSANPQEVQWFLNGVSYKSVTVPVGENKAELEIALVKQDRSVIVQCRSPASGSVRMRISQEETFV